MPRQGGGGEEGEDTPHPKGLTEEEEEEEEEEGEVEVGEVVTPWAPTHSAPW